MLIDHLPRPVTLTNCLYIAQVLRQQLDVLQHQVSQLSLHRQYWHQQQQEQAAIAASAQDNPEAGPSSSTSQASTSQPAPHADAQASVPGAEATANGQQNAG